MSIPHFSRSIKGQTFVSKGTLFTMSFYNPDIVTTQHGAIIAGLKNWMTARTQWYEDYYIKRLVSGWSSQNQPTFKRAFSVIGADTAKLQWYTTSPPLAYLDPGTKTRKVIVDGSPKTRKGAFNNSRGTGTKVRKHRGRKVFFKGKAARKKRRIKERAWMKKIAKLENQRLNTSKLGSGEPGIVMLLLQEGVTARQLTVSRAKRLADGQFNALPTVIITRKTGV